jgi:hypothetical protein
MAMIDIDDRAAAVLVALLDDNEAMDRALEAARQSSRTGAGDLQARVGDLAALLSEQGEEVPEEHLPTPEEANQLRMSRTQEALRYAREVGGGTGHSPPSLAETKAAIRAMTGRPGMSFEAALAAVRRTYH